MRCRQEVSFSSLTATLFHSFVRKKVFYSESVQYVHNVYGTDLYPPVCNVCRGLFRTQSKIYGGACDNHKRALLQMLDWVLNTSLVQVLQQKRFTECQNLLQIFVTAFLFLQLIKLMLVYRRSDVLSGFLLLPRS